ncbi:MAG: metallophosphoesterase [Flavonifractor plautii]
MALYAIGDTHLSLSSAAHGRVRRGLGGYVDKLQKGFAAVGPEDTVVLCGDLSWGMSLEEAKEDFAFLDALPGARKLLLKGNHDYWWNTAAKMNRFLRRAAFPPPHSAQQLL